VLSNSGQRYLYRLGEPAGSTGISARVDSDGNFRVGAPGAAGNVRNSIPIAEEHLFANRVTSSEARSFLSGDYSRTDTITYSGADYGTCRIGSQNVANFLGGWIEELQICPPLSDAELLAWVNV
jgi:hypothetical protein